MSDYTLIPDAPPAPVPDVAPALVTIEALAKQKNTPDWLFAATKAANKWAIGKEISESDFDAALVAVGEMQMLPSAPLPTPSP